MVTTVSVDDFAGKQFDYLIGIAFINPITPVCPLADHIKVGGGTAGLVLASRLSEDEEVQVGVIEAGSSKLDDPIVDTIDGFGAAFQNPSYDWMFRSTAQVGA